MKDIVEIKFKEWTENRDAAEARISIFNNIRDIPYAVIPDQISPTGYIDILKQNRGSCTPKHFIMCDMYQQLGLAVLYAVYSFRWIDAQLDYPPSLRKLAKDLPLSQHLACRVEINGRLTLVDATVDAGLGKLGLPVNRYWDGLSDTMLPMIPSGEEQLYHPSEATLMVPQIDERSWKFYEELNNWLEEVRLC